jgi:hypothetical protein
MPADTVSPPPQNKTVRPLLDGAYGMQNMSDESVATLNQANESLSRIGGAYMAVSSDNMAALIEAATLSGRLATDMTKSYVDAMSLAAVNYAGLGRDCLTCRTPADVVELQKKAMEGFNESCEAVNKVYSNLFETFSAAFQPLMARSADGPERMFRAFAD